MWVYERVKKLCRMSGRTLKQLEKEAGLGTKSISNWRHSNPSVDAVAKVAKVLGVTVDFLLYGDGHEQTHHG